MPSLIGLLRGEEAAKRAEREKAQKTAAGRYLALLRRADTPKAGDADELRKVLAALGKSLEDFESDAALVGQIAELEGLAAQYDEAQAARVKAFEEIEAWRNSIQDKDRELQGKVAVANDRLTKTMNARTELKRLKDERPDLLG